MKSAFSSGNPSKLIRFFIDALNLY